MRSKSSLLILVAHSFVSAAHAVPTISADDTRANAGKEVIVCGIAYQVKNFNKGTYINIGGTYPYQKIGFLVWEQDKPKFEHRFGSWSAFPGNKLCGRGMIKKYKEGFQMELSSPANLKFE